MCFIECRFSFEPKVLCNARSFCKNPLGKAALFKPIN